MAHEFETGFFTRTPAWHKLGTVVEEAPSVKDAILLAGLDWPVEERKLLAMNDEGHPLLQIPTHKALFRGTDKQLLGVVGADYQVMQNTKAFEFFEPFVQSKLVKLEAAGSLKGGKRVWVLAKIDGADGNVVGNDAVRGYLLLSNAHDGTQAVRVQFTSIRVVCWNTLSAAENAKAERFISVRHTGRLESGLDAVQKSVDIARKTFDISIENYKKLAEAGCSWDQLQQYVRKVFGYEARPLDEMPRCWDYIATVFERGPGVGTIAGVKGTWWAAYNAVTDYIDHAQGQGRGEESRLHSSWFGVGGVRRNEAMRYASQAALN